MNIKEKLLLHILCNLFSISFSTPEKWMKLEQTTVPVPDYIKVTTAELGRNLKTELFGDLHLWEETKGTIEEKIRKKYSGEKINKGRLPELRETDAKITQLKNYERELNGLIQNDWKKSFQKFFQARKSTSEESLRMSFAQKLNNLSSYLKTLKKQSQSFQNLIRDLQALQKEFSVHPHKNVEKPWKNGKKVAIGNEIKNEKWALGETDSEAINNTSYNNRYQIDTIFIINRLSEETEKADLKFNGCKEADGEIFTELTVRKIKELLMQILNNLQGEGFLRTTESIPAKTADKLVENIESDFRQMFAGRNVTSKQTEQMSKIIDFVRKYHGIVSDPAYWTMPEETLDTKGQTQARDEQEGKAKKAKRNRKSYFEFPA